MKKYLAQRWSEFVCWALTHDWTCNAAEGIKPNEFQRRTYNGFLQYATEWCKRCGEESDPDPLAKSFAEAMFRGNPMREKLNRRTHNEKNG